MSVSWEARRRLTRIWISLLCAAAAAFSMAWTGGTLPLDGPLLDVLVWARAELFPHSPSADEPVAVVAVDQHSLDDPDLQVYPRAMFGPVWASLLDVLMVAEAKVVGFDLLFSYSANNLFQDFDKPFLTALSQHTNRIVLARSASTLPALPYQAAMGFDERALGLVELMADADGTYRRISAGLATEQGERMPSLVSAVLSRAAAPAMSAELHLAPRRHLEAVPTYSLIDVLHCSRNAAEVVASVFHGKIVFVGTTLAEEDRKRSPARYLSQPMPGSPLHPCGLRRLGASVPRARTVPGVYIHAAAVEAILRGEVVTVAPLWIIITLAAGSAATGSLMVLQLPPWRAVTIILGLALVLLLSATASLEQNLWVPMAMPLLALSGSAALAYLARYVFEERARRQIQLAFSHYLAPAIVEQLAKDPAALKLGGERREVTVMFADLSGFTQLSTRVSPESLTAMTNRYLGYVADEVEATGGYVDKFVGDAVLAIWGAPALDPMHGIHAVQAAMRIVTRIAKARAEAVAAGEPSFAIKIGMNAGPAIVGNVGTDKRYNYTAMGETVNLASRLEGIPGLYGCRIVLGPVLAKLVEGEFLLRELDWIVVKGMDEPQTIYEPLALRTEATDAQREVAREYAKGLAEYRAGRFTDATGLWEQVAEREAVLAGGSDRSGLPGDNPSLKMAARARYIAAHPPTEPWTGVRTLIGKSEP